MTNDAPGAAPSRNTPRYTHGHHASVLESHRVRTAENSAAYLLDGVRLSAQSRLLDVGCGPATITCDLAGLAGSVTAIEPVDSALDLGRAEARRRGVQNITFVRADVYDLPFEASSFDVVHAHQVLQHVPDPVEALRAMSAVCAHDGWIAARDADYAGFVWYPELPALDDWLRLYRTIAKANSGEPDAGRRMLSWAQQAGLREITATASVWSYGTPEARETWGGMWSRRVLESDLAEQAVADGHATRADLERISQAWLEWAAADDGWLTIPHGEILARPAG